MPDQVTARCMYCDAPGVTHAHIFAKSWTSLFDEPNDTREHEVVHHYTDPITRQKREIKRSKTFALTSRKVCGSCNSGWLNRLEQRVRPVVARFAANEPINLTAAEQADVALWAVTAALIAMSRDPDAAGFADPALAPEVYAHQRPPARTEIWLGANTHGHMGWFGSHSLTIPRAAETQAWGATITLGYAVLHIVHHGVPDQRMRLRGEAHRSLRRVWPTRERRVTWPPPLLMNPRDLTPLAVIVGEQSSFERAVVRT